MNRVTAVQWVQSGVVSLVLFGVGYGLAVGWDPVWGTYDMAVAATVVFVAMAVGILLAGYLREVQDRPSHAPTPFRAGFGTSLGLMLLASFPVLLTGAARLGPYAAWFAVHAVAQSVLALRVFRRQDPREAAALEARHRIAS
jgi:hypothetical protein